MCSIAGVTSTNHNKIVNTMLNLMRHRALIRKFIMMTKLH